MDTIIVYNKYNIRLACITDNDKNEIIDNDLLNPNYVTTSIQMFDNINDSHLYLKINYNYFTNHKIKELCNNLPKTIISLQFQYNKLLVSDSFGENIPIFSMNTKTYINNLNNNLKYLYNKTCYVYIKYECLPSSLIHIDENVILRDYKNNKICLNYLPNKLKSIAINKERLPRKKIKFPKSLEFLYVY